MAEEQAIIVRQLEAMPVGQRVSDGYINATAMCQVVDKRWNDYWRLDTTQAFLGELAGVAGIPVTLLIHSKQGGRKDEQGTWVHPQVAVNLAQWCSPKFAVQVSAWVLEWARTGKNPLQTISVLSLYNNEALQKAMSITFHGFLSRVNGNFAKENAVLCEVHSDYHWQPWRYKEFGKKLGLPYKDRCSGLAVLRRTEPPSVGAITTEKWARMSGAEIMAARAIAHKAKEVYALIHAAGITCQEMQAIEPTEEQSA